MKNYKNFLLENLFDGRLDGQSDENPHSKINKHKVAKDSAKDRKQYSSWFKFKDLYNLKLYTKKELNEIKKNVIDTFCVGDNDLIESIGDDMECVFINYYDDKLSEKDNFDNFEINNDKLNNINKGKSHFNLDSNNKNGDYFGKIFKVPNTIFPLYISLYITKNNCKKQKTNDGKWYEQNISDRINLSCGEKTLTLSDKDNTKWDAKGKVCVDFFNKDNFNFNFTNNFISKINSMDNDYYWNIKSMGKSSIDMSDFLRISGLMKNPNKNTVEDDFIIEIKNKDKIKHFMFVVGFYKDSIMNMTSENFILMDTDFWTKKLPKLYNEDKHIIKDTIQKMYEDLEQHQYNAKIITQEFFKENNLDDITIGKNTNIYDDKSGENKVYTDDDIKILKNNKEKEILDKILSSEEWTISFSGNKDKIYTSKDEDKNYTDFKKKKDKEWYDYRSNASKQIEGNNNNDENIMLAFKRDHTTSQLRIQATINKTLFEKMIKYNPSATTYDLKEINNQ